MNQTFIPELDVFYAVIYLTTFVVGTLLNVAAFWYFLKEPNHLIVILYRFISFNDIVICLMVLPLALTSTAHNKPVVFSVRAICVAWPYIWSTIVKVSVFGISVMSVTRMLRIIKPFWEIPTKLVVGIIVFGIVVHIGLRGFLQYSGRTFYDGVRGWCRTAPQYYKLSLYVFNISMILPVFLLSLSCLVSVIALYRHATIPNKSSEASRRLAIQSSITIQIVTFLYLICNIPLTVLTVRAFTNRDEIRRPTFREAYAAEAWFVVTVAVNSLLNPVIYLARMNNFVKFLSQTWIVQSTRGTWYMISSRSSLWQ